MSCVRIILLSDDRLFCDGVTRLLNSDAAFEVMIYDGADALQSPAPGMPADVLLIDSRMEGSLVMAGSRTYARATLLIAAPSDDAWCRDALCGGASGVLPKHAGGSALSEAVRTVAAGSVWAPRRVLADCIRALINTSATRHARAASRDGSLSRREREIFQYAAAGLANKELADRLSIGEATVKAHLTKIFQKLGVRGRSELAAVYHGVAPVPQHLVVRQKSNVLTLRTAKK